MYIYLLFCPLGRLLACRLSRQDVAPGIYIYIYIYTHIYNYTYIYISINEYINAYTCTRTSSWALLADSRPAIYLCISICVYIHIYIYIYIYKYIHIYTHIYIYIYIHTSTRTSSSAFLADSRPAACRATPTLHHAYIYIYTHIYTYKYTHIHTHTNIYTHAPPPGPSWHTRGQPLYIYL